MEDILGQLIQCTGELSSLSAGLVEQITPLSDTERVAIGRDLLQLFLQFNWTGPPSSALSLPLSLLDSWNNECYREIEYDGESYHRACHHPCLLYMAHVILVDHTHLSKTRECVWQLRCLYTEQQLLAHHSQSLWKRIECIIDKDLIPLISQSVGEDPQWLCALHLELFYCLIYYYQQEQAAHHLHAAEKLMGVVSSLTGVLGKRTQYQQHDVAQLVLNVAVAQSDNSTLNNHEQSDLFPKDVMLEDDTLLPHVQLTDSLSTNPSQLSALQQAVVLAQCVYYQKTNAVHRLTTETLETYLDCVLQCPQCWSVQSAALFLRSVLQKGRRRTMERSMMQLQELVDCCSRSSPEASHRLKLIQSVGCPPSWIVERELASVLVALGDVHSALEVYKRLQMWEELVQCYLAVGRRGEAERVVRERMKEEGETAILCCLLGDTTQDPVWYERAWEVSHHRNSRAQRSLGLLYLRKGEYMQCVECLQKSLNINSLQVGLWFSLGCAAATLNDLVLACKAFTRCVSLDSENFEAWNNLAGVCVRRNDKEKAFVAYQHAIRGCYDNWMIWENYLLVCLDIGEFDEVMTAYHRLMNLKNKYIDTEVLAHLVDAVVSGTMSRSGRSADLLRKKLGELLGRATSQITNNVELWEMSAKYHLSDASDPVSQDKGLMELQRAQRSCRLEPMWEKDKEKIKRVISLTLHYSTACREQCHRSHLSSAKLAVQSIISRLKQIEGDYHEQLDQLKTEQLQIAKLLTT